MTYAGTPEPNMQEGSIEMIKRETFKTKGNYFFLL